MEISRTARLLLAVCLALTTWEAAAGGADQKCPTFFANIQNKLGRCKYMLTQISVANRTECPDDCHGVFEGLPKQCAAFVNRTMPPSYKGPAPDGEQPFDICDRLYCPENEQECGVSVDLLRSLDLFRLPYLVGGGGGWENTGGSSVNVAAIVAGVVVGNAAIVALVGIVILLRRRLKRRQRISEQLAPACAPPGTEAASSSFTSGGSKLDNLDSAECGERSKPAAKGMTITAAAVAAPLRSGVPAAHGKPYAGSDSNSSWIGVQTPPSPFGSQNLAQLWAAAAARGPRGAGPSPSQLSSITTLTDHMQQDELEMMQMHGEAAAQQTQEEFQSAVQHDPMLAWVSSQVQHEEEGEHARSGRSSTEAGRAPCADSGSPMVAGPSGRSGLIDPSLSTALSQRRSSAMVDLKAWQLRYSELKIQRPLGEGSFGKVFLATWNETLVAVKLLISTEDAATASKSGNSSTSTLSLSAPSMEALQKEAGLMASLRHPNVVLFLGVCASPPAVVTEYCSRGSLLDVLRLGGGSEQAAAQLTWVRRLSMALDAAKGMLCLHAHNPPILHRDLKSPNLLVDAAWRVKVCDFNLSKLMEDSARSSTASGMLNPRWLAPEVLMGQPATAASDVFSYGTVLWELLTWRLPWEGANLYQLVFMVSRGERLPVPAREDLPGPDQLTEADYDAYVGIIQRCWAQEPSERPTFADIIAELRGIISRMVAASSAPPAAA